MSGAGERLVRLAGRLGIERTFWDTAGDEHVAGEETLRAIIAAMGFAADTEGDLDAASTAVAADTTARLVPQSWCVDEGGWLCFPVRAMSGDFRWTIELEDGGTLERSGRLDDLHTYDGEEVPSRALLIEVPVPIGIHRLRFETTDRSDDLCLIIAPPRAVSVADAVGADRRLWGLTAPLYGLTSKRNFGIGDFDDLGRLAETAASLGADFLGINPVHALFPEAPEAASPYSPSSRLFLNVMHIAPDKVPEFADSAAARRFAEQKAPALEADRSRPLVDYTRAAGIKLPIFEHLFSAFLESGPGSPRYRAFRQFCAASGDRLRRHATFDALSRHFAMIGRHRSWLDWPAAYRDPQSSAVAEFAANFERDVLFFEYLQWIADAQLGEAARRAGDAGMKLGLYLDLAVGVPRGGSDVWAAQKDYSSGVSLGAPPDAFSADGQRWGLLPFNPVELSRQGFGPFIAMLRAVMRHAGAIRIDHVLGLARSFWVPAGLPGAYVRYPLYELLAIVAIESRRAGTVVIGEDLGNVPGGLREALAARGVLGCRVAYFERCGNGDFKPPADYPENVLASIGSHDLPTLKGYWRGTDIKWRAEINGNLAGAAGDDARRADDRRALCRLAGCDGDPDADPKLNGAAYDRVCTNLHRLLAASPSVLVAVESENLLGVEQQANLPGTIDQHPNWRRRMAVPVEAFAECASVRDLSAVMRAERSRS